MSVPVRAAPAMAMVLLFAAAACGSAPPPAPPPPAPPPPVEAVELPAYHCGLPDEAGSTDAMAPVVHELAARLGEYVDAVGPIVGAQRDALRASLAEVGDFGALARAALALESAVAPALPAGWASRRAAWARRLADPPRPHGIGEAIRELLVATARRPGLDLELRESLRRIHTRLSLLLDTCLAAG